ncbi:MAG TPA: hypothetical protein VFQ61_27185 [Polyangiaceae bacterium]|nr:hypothetical protein [Polyangiaceae bacterium]
MRAVGLLDGMVRAALGRHEKGELLACAVEVTNALGLSASDEPVAGNYTDVRSRCHGRHG